MSFRSTVILQAILLIAGASWLSGQVETGLIVGTISDPTGASIPAANIGIKSAATGLQLYKNFIHWNP